LGSAFSFALALRLFPKPLKVGLGFEQYRKESGDRTDTPRLRIAVFMRARTKSIPRPRVLKVAAAFLLVLVSPLLLIGAALAFWTIYIAIVPAFAASTEIPGNNITVRLQFFWIDDLFDDGLQKSGRFLTITSPRGRVDYNMPGWDWAHRARTSLYLTENNDLAILGPDEEDILIAGDPAKVSRAFRIPSQSWTYLGAFDFVQPVIGGYDRSLRFIPALEQEECVPDQSPTPATPRNHARAMRCPTLQSKG
jgi:hypothetical protein